LKNTKISIFGGISKFLKLIVFGQFWADFAALQWLTACLNYGWNLQILITFEPWVQTQRVVSHWKATIYIYSLKKFQKINFFIAFTVACPKVQKAVLAAIVLQGLNHLFGVVLRRFFGSNRKSLLISWFIPFLKSLAHSFSDTHVLASL
jgi:hypothetical protein